MYLSHGQLSVANTSRDGTGTLVDIAVGMEKGTAVSSVHVVSAGTVALGRIRLFVFDGTNTRLYAEVAIAALTVVVGTDPVSVSDLATPNLYLKSGWKLKAGTNNAEVFNVFATCQDGV